MTTESEQPRNVESLLLQLEARWEEPYVDFKQALSIRRREDKAEFIKDVLGLVTTQGSSRRFLLIGWNDKTRSVEPPGVDPRISEERLQQVLNAYCDPPPHITYFTHAWRGVRVGVVEILRESIRVPYSVSKKIGARTEGEVFVRHGTITEPPTSGELDALRQEGLNAKLREGANPLIRPDQVTLRFTGLGFSPGGLLSPEAATRLQEHNIAVELVEGVPDSTRKLFARLQAIHMQGIWEYQMFTVADSYALQVLEHALAHRLLTYYTNQVPVLDSSGRRQTVETGNFDDLLATIGRRKYRLVSLTAPETSVNFAGTFGDLFVWARHEGLLRGQRSRRFDLVFPRMLKSTRPLEYALHMPVDSGRSIREVGEFINQIWGSSSPTGRIFPSPQPRRMLVLGWPPDRRQVGSFWLETLSEEHDKLDWEYIVVLCVDSDDEILQFHSDFEFTNFPARLLMGPAAWGETIEWLAREQVETDSVEIVDRWFVVELGDSPGARNLGQFAGLPRGQRGGRWLLVQADFPGDARVHARKALQSPAEHRAVGVCNHCWVEAKVAGSWSRVLNEATRLGIDVIPIAPANVETPLRY
ncbi:MAG: AlbA family DNA-binding domain-containing protein [Candidatus Dormibacteraceae bacterium]